MAPKIPLRFETLDIKRRSLSAEAPKSWRVYKDAGNFVMAKGKTVSEALKASGIENAYRVMLHDILDETVLVDTDLTDAKKPEAAATAAPVETPAEPAAPAEPEKPAT